MIDNFEEHLNKEIYKNEIFRTTLVAVISVFFLLGFNIVTNISKDELQRDFTNFNAIYIASGIMLFFAAREVLIRIYLKRRKNQDSLPTPFRYFNVFIEISIPSVIFLIFILNAKSIAVLMSPIVLIYFLMILTTILAVDFKISLFSGVVAAIEYCLIITYALSFEWEQQIYSSILYEFTFYLGRGLIMVIAGILAGVIGIQLKKRIFNSFKIMEDRYKIRNLFGQQVSQEIVDELTEDSEKLESKKLFVCVMFLDIREFTKYAENRDPNEIIEFQNQVFGFMIDIILKYKGVINQFLGDGYMATFGIPFSRGNDVQNAVDASIEILTTLKNKISNHKLPEIKIGIGLHAGNVVAGNVGTEQRKQYSVSGETVIIASRIEQLNKKFGSQLLISEEVIEKAERTTLNYENLGPVTVKGREMPVKIFNIGI